MFVLHEKESGMLPVKVWLASAGQLESGCLEQAQNLARLPFAFRHVALMPDVHQGYGMPIGGVLATKDVVVINAIGVDIACGITFVQTDIPADILGKYNTPGGPLKNYITDQIMRAVPTGFDHHKTPQESQALKDFEPRYPVNEPMPELDAARYQLGTLGGGNHFIELQADPEGRLCVMIHSGSRNLGYKIASHFDKLAIALNTRWYSAVRDEWELSFLPVDTDEGQAYLEWMFLAMDFARENRNVMMERVLDIIRHAASDYANVKDMKTLMSLDVHHNYVDIENHFGKNVWVHRKGAIRARVGDMGIVPGAMGAHSYIVEGLGNPESFKSCSHGAGRLMGRKEAMRYFTAEDVINDLTGSGIVLGKTKCEDAADECRWAYKDLDNVLANESDLVRPVMRLTNAGIVVKG